jgi:AraC-like DNA-binding protein
MSASSCVNITDLIDRCPFGRLQIRIIILCGLVALLEGFDLLAISVAAPAMAGPLHIASNQFGFLFSAALFGLMLGAFGLGPMADRYGRRRVLSPSCQPLHPLRVELRRNPAHREIHEAHYGCRVKFKAPRNAIVFRTADLDRPFTSYNAELLAMLGGQLERELAERKVWQTTVAARVKWILLRLLGGQSANLGEVAKDLGMSNRTLQRRITSEGTSFRRLVRGARYELAKHYLLDPSLDLAETAYLFGYEDPNSFFRAFREWEGTTPSEWRAVQRGQSVQNEQSRLARPIRQLLA